MRRCDCPRTQCLPRFLLTKACSGHRAMHMVGFLKAYQSLLSENAWIMPNANRTAQISYSESWKSFPRFQNCHLRMVVHHGTKGISALEPCASTMPGYMGRQLGGIGWTEETRKIWENHQKMIGNLCQIPFLHESLLDLTTLPPVSEPLFCQIHRWERPGQGHARCLQ